MISMHALLCVLLCVILVILALLVALEMRHRMNGLINGGAAAAPKSNNGHVRLVAMGLTTVLEDPDLLVKYLELLRRLAGLTLREPALRHNQLPPIPQSFVLLWNSVHTVVDENTTLTPENIDQIRGSIRTMLTEVNAGASEKSKETHKKEYMRASALAIIYIGDDATLTRALIDMLQSFARHPQRITSIMAINNLLVAGIMEANKKAGTRDEFITMAKDSILGALKYAALGGVIG